MGHLQIYEAANVDMCLYKRNAIDPKPSVHFSYAYMAEVNICVISNVSVV